MIFPKVHHVERTFKMQLNFRILLIKPYERRRGKQRVQTVRNADAHETFRFAATVTNAGAARASGLVAHLDVVSLDPDVVVIEDEGKDETNAVVYRSRQLWVVRTAPKHSPGDLHE